MDADFFNGLAKETVKTSAGECELPILYRDGSVIGLMYRIDPDRVAPCITESEHFEPFTLLGKAIVQLVVFEYRETSIGPYNEVALAVEVKRKGTNPSTWGALVNAKKQYDYGSYFVNLPVTTEGACAAGREIWGYPKYVVDIKTEFSAEGVHAVQAGEFDLKVGKASWLATRGIPFVLMSVKGEHIIRTIVETDHDLSWGGAGDVSLEILGKGPTADNLEKMGLASMKPSFAWRTMGLRTILPRGVELT